MKAKRQTGILKPSMIEYKVIELSAVSDENIEKALNEWTAKGWKFDHICFAMRDASRRPSMAFVMFSRDKTGDDAEGE